MKKTSGTRILSLLLTLVMIFGLVAVAPLTASAAVVEYATPATEAELSAVPEWFGADNGAGAGPAAAFAKLVNGTVYVWGRNTSYVLGITSYKDVAGNTVAVSEGTSVPVPTAIPASAFGNEKVTRIAITYHSGMALTENNHIYVWGSCLGGALGLGTAATPVLLDTSAVGSNKIVDMKHTGFMAYVKDEQGNWYTAGAAATGAGGALLQGGGSMKITKLTKVPASIYTAIGNRQIKDINGEWQAVSLVLTEDGKLFAFGKDNNGTQGTGLGGTTDYTTTAANLSNIDAFKNLTFTYITGEDQAFAAVDSNGDVWAWGTNGSNRLGVSNSIIIGQNTKIFDHNVFQKKAVRVLMSFNRTVIICDDNTVYAMGSNANGSIVPGGAGSISTPTQIFKDLSKQVTIVGVYPNHVGIMAITKSGDMFYAGENTYGSSGDGTTTNAPTGTTTTVTSSSLPPSKPMTANKVSFEIEVTEDNSVVTYRPVENSNGSKYYRTVGATTTTVDNLTIDAGRNFKLNVYFEDFGKINSFVMPIRFDPNNLEVVNGAGKAYSRNSAVVTPGSLGASVGIEQCFTIRDWNGGALATGTKDGTYPKISNADGWVSVAGYSADSNPIIKDRVKMFSISFRARNTVTNNGLRFDFATEDNTYDNNIGYGYDVTCNGLAKGLAYWSIYNASGNGGESSYFEFEHEPFPAFNSKLLVLRSIGLSMTYGTNNAPVTDTIASSDPCSPGWNINWSNSSVVYTITANPYNDANKTSPGASFPQVTWSFDTAHVSGANNWDREWSDYITIVDTQDTYVRFKVNPSFAANPDEDPGYILVTAKSQSYSSVFATSYVCLHSYTAPETLELAQKASDDAPLVRLPDNAEMIYHYISDPSENTRFYVDFGGATNNTDVVWSLLDSNGDPIDSTDPEAKVTLSRNGDGSVTIEPHYTTKGDDYVTLHVESLFDSSKFDEAKIKIQLYATKIGFSPDVIRMAVMKDSVPSSIDLSQYLQVQPMDVYATNYTWEITDNPTRDPANANKVDPDFAPGTAVTYGSLGTGSTAATFTAYEWATPVASEEAGDEQFVTVTVTETYSGKEAQMKIAIMDLNSPIGIDQFVATNNLGYLNDTVFVKDGLQKDDILEFYPTYEDAVNKNNLYSKVTIVDGMYPYFTFVVGTRTDSLMKGEGGFLAVTLTRNEETTGEPRTYDPVPVSYSAEPSLVDGYVHLFGKNTGSIADKDIRVDLEGLNFKETVYTDTTGYFKFTKYIAPGTYTMVVSKQNYLTRRMEANSAGVGGLTIQVNDDGEFHISTYNQPILLFPGELTNDNAITIQDINYYVANWVGQYDPNIIDYDLYDFYEDNLISMRDLELLLMRKDWTSGSYAVWTVPNQ